MPDSVEEEIWAHRSPFAGREFSCTIHHCRAATLLQKDTHSGPKVASGDRHSHAKELVSVESDVCLLFPRGASLEVDGYKKFQGDRCSKS